jgi:uncharacterized protein (TIGR00730 family)
MRISFTKPSHPLKLGFSRDNGEVDEIIDHLIELTGGVHYPDSVREMILTALKAGQENSQKADLKLMTSTLKEMRFTAKAFGPYRGRRKVTIFGSARVKSGDTIYQLARALGEKLSQAGYMVITGGGQGIMRAANEGAGAEHSFGVNIRLPFENQPNHILEGSPRSITYKYFFNRKVAFIKETDAVALFPGGFGTQDEAMEVLTLVQTGKSYPIPLVLVDEPGGSYWSHWKLYVERELAARGYIGKDDFSLFDTVQSVDDAVKIVDRFYKRYHSLRFVGERLVIRINSPIGQEKVVKLKEQYSDILLSGGDLFASKALPEEADEPGLSHLPRLVLDFNRKAYARLRQLIDSINVI